MDTASVFKSDSFDVVGIILVMSSESDGQVEPDASFVNFHKDAGWRLDRTLASQDWVCDNSGGRWLKRLSTATPRPPSEELGSRKSLSRTVRCLDETYVLAGLQSPQWYGWVTE